MQDLMHELREKHEQDLTFEDGKVQWDKELLLILRKWGYDLKLEDHATRVYLYRDAKQIGEVNYEVKEREPDFDYTDHYQVLMLDLTQIN